MAAKTVTVSVTEKIQRAKVTQEPPELEPAEVPDGLRVVLALIITEARGRGSRVAAAGRNARANAVRTQRISESFPAVKAGAK